MLCPGCKKDYPVANQIKEADEEYYKGEVSPPIMLMLSCPHCNEQTVMVEFVPCTEFEEIDSPLGKVKIPKMDPLAMMGKPMPQHRRYCGKSGMVCAVAHGPEGCPDVRDCEACKIENGHR